MSILDDLLANTGLKYEDLDSPGHLGEKEYLLNMVKQLETRALTVEDIKQTISQMRVRVTQDLIEEPEFNYIFIFKVPNRKQILLKARLKNYILLEEALLTPEKIKKAIEAQLHNAAKKKG